MSELGARAADVVGRPRKMADDEVLDKTTRFHFHAHIIKIVRTRIAMTVGSRGLQKQWPRPLLSLPVLGLYSMTSVVPGPNTQTPVEP